MEQPLNHYKYSKDAVLVTNFTTFKENIKMIEHKIPTRSQKTYFQLFFWIPVIIIIICNNHICQKIHGQTKHLLCAFPKFEMLLIIFRIIIFSRNTSVELIVAKQYGSCPLYRGIIWLIESFVIFHASLSFHFLLVLTIYIKCFFTNAHSICHLLEYFK